jgi:hypothetical protein
MRFLLQHIAKHDEIVVRCEELCWMYIASRLYHGYWRAPALPTIPKLITTKLLSHNSRSIISLWSDVSRVPEFLLQSVMFSTSYRPLPTQSIPSGLNQSTLVAQSSNLSSTSSGKKVGAGSRFER